MCIIFVSLFFFRHHRQPMPRHSCQVVAVLTDGGARLPIVLPWHAAKFTHPRDPATAVQQAHPAATNGTTYLGCAWDPTSIQTVSMCKSKQPMHASRESTAQGLQQTQACDTNLDKTSRHQSQHRGARMDLKPSLQTISSGKTGQKHDTCEVMPGTSPILCQRNKTAERT